jgi:hypothetical protein
MRRLLFVLTLLASAALAPPSLAANEKPTTFTDDPGFSAEGQGQAIRARLGRDPLRPSLMPCCGDATHCWSTTTTRSRGLWPYGRAIHLYTIWCAQGGIINYRDSSAWPSVDFLCGASDLWWGKVAGGAGWPFVDVQAQAAFACNSPWWFDWHDFLMQRIRYHPNGWYETIAYQ